MTRSLPRGACAALVVLLWVGGTLPARAYEVNDDLTVWGYFQAWVTLYEEMVFAPDPRPDQYPSGDSGVDSTTGFSLNRARVGFDGRLAGELLGVACHVKLESPVQLLDLYLHSTPVRGLTLRLGQMRIPSAYENLVRNSDLDFILRTDTAAALIDYALSRTTYASSLFYGNKAFLRDFGLALLGDYDLAGVPLRFQLMISNGLGANLFVGGDTQIQHLATNRVLQLFYGLRLEVEPVPGVLTLGGHYSYNQHDDVVLESKRAVYDLNRQSYSGDVLVRVPETGLRLRVLFGAGSILDDFDDNGRADYLYSGREWRVIWRLNPALRALGGDPGILAEHVVELGARWERFSSEADESGLLDRRDNWTFGATYRWREHLKVQLNAILHRVDEPYAPADLDHDVFLLSVQVAG